MASKNTVLKKGTISKREFDYSKGEVSLNFTLRVDNSSQLRPFLDILEAATEDVREILKGMKN